MTILLTPQVVTTLLTWLEEQYPAELARYQADQPMASELNGIAQYLDAEPTPLPELAETPALLLLATDIIGDLDQPGVLQTYHPLAVYFINGDMDTHTARFSLYHYVTVLLRLIARTRTGAVPSPVGMTIGLAPNPQSGKIASFSPTYSPKANDFYVDGWVGLNALVSEYT